jgi:hypothetical protein
MKNLFEISSEEKQRILEMHIVATKKQYLFEQLKKINIKVTDGEKPVAGAAIIDSGDKYNGVVTDANGEATFNKFTGPSFSVTMIGFTTKEVKPDSENVNVSLDVSSDVAKTLEIKSTPLKNIKIIDSETKKPIQGAQIEVEVGKVKGDTENEMKTLSTDDSGVFKFDFDRYFGEIVIKKDGYQTNRTMLIWDESKSKNEPYETIKLEEIVEVPDELTYLIGKVFRFLDSKMKKPGWFKILEAQYVEDGNRTTTELTTSYCQVQNKCDDTPSFTIIYDCDRIAFKVQEKSDAWTRKAIDFVVKNYLYCDDLQTYLLDNSKTKTCTLNKS